MPRPVLHKARDSQYSNLVTEAALGVDERTEPGVFGNRREHCARQIGRQKDIRRAIVRADDRDHHLHEIARRGPQPRRRQLRMESKAMSIDHAIGPVPERQQCNPRRLGKRLVVRRAQRQRLQHEPFNCGGITLAGHMPT